MQIRRRGLFWFGCLLLLLGSFLAVLSYHEFCTGYAGNGYYCWAYTSLGVLFDFIGAHEPAITALATIAVAAFTGTLWWSTHGMLRATSATLDLARQEFIATHRPRLVVYGVDVQFGDYDDDAAPVQFRYVNTGDSDAKIVEIGTRLVKLKAEKLPPFIEFSVVKFDEPIEIKSGAHGFKMTDDRIDALTIAFSDEVGVNPNLICLGYIIYTDAIGTVRQMGFCRKFDSRTDRWSKVEDEDYEYSY